VGMGSHEAAPEEKLFDRCQSLILRHLPGPSDPERLGSALPAQVFLLVLPHCMWVGEPAQIHWGSSFDAVVAEGEEVGWAWVLSRDQ
jgi:hypothetical protein